MNKIKLLKHSFKLKGNTRDRIHILDPHTENILCRPCAYSFQKTEILEPDRAIDKVSCDDCLKVYHFLINSGRGLAVDCKKIRPEVNVFAERMEEILKINDYKNGWENCSKDFLMSKVFEELGEMVIAIGCASHNDKIDVQNEIIDVANFLMMLWDKLEKQRKL